MPERQLTIQQKRYLKFAHLFFAALWGGGATTMVLLFCLFHPSTAHEQITFSKILFYIDFIIVGPGAGGCLGSGLVIFKGTKTGYAEGMEVSHAYPDLSFRKPVGAYQTVLSPFSRCSACR